MIYDNNLFGKEDERRKNLELRSITAFIEEFEQSSGRTAWESISQLHTLITEILRESKDLSVSQELVATFETNRKMIEEIYNPDIKKSKTLATALSNYLHRLMEMLHREKTTGQKETSETTEEQRLDEFLRNYVIRQIQDFRVLLLMMMTIIYRRIHNFNTPAFKAKAFTLSSLLKKNRVKPDKALTILIYNLCQASVDALEESEYRQGVFYCERAVELFKMISDGSKIKEIIRGQIEEAMRITTERMINKIQEKPSSEQVEIVETIAGELVNIEIFGYLLPQLVFFLIRAQKYESCLQHLETILSAEDLTRDFLNYQTVITIGYEWCDSLLKAERYSKGKAKFSFVEKEKHNIKRVFDLMNSISVPDMEDETFYNVEIEKLAVTYSHLGTLFFLSQEIELSSEAYDRSFTTILQKKCSRNRNSVDEILDRYKDAIHHPLNSAPTEAQPLIASFACERGYDFLLEAQIAKFTEEQIEFVREEQNFHTLINPQKQIISDLMESALGKSKTPYPQKYAAFKPFIQNKLHLVKEKMKL